MVAGQGGECPGGVVVWLFSGPGGRFVVLVLLQVDATRPAVLGVAVSGNCLQTTGPLGGEVAQEQCLYIPAVLISFITHTLRGRVTGNRLALARGHTAVGLFKKCFCKGDGHQEAVCPWPSLLTSWALCVMWVGGALGCCLRQCGRRVKGADGRARPPVSSPGSSTWKLGGFG